MKLKVKKLYSGAQIPVRVKPNDSGADVFAHNVKRVYKCIANIDFSTKETFDTKDIFINDSILYLAPKDRALIGTGISATYGTNHEIQVRPRSGCSLKEGLTIVNTPGTVDAGYRGEICIILINNSHVCQEVMKGDRIAQIVVCPVVPCEIEEVEDLDETERGAGGFGSTGKN